MNRTIKTKMKKMKKTRVKTKRKMNQTTQEKRRSRSQTDITSLEGRQRVEKPTPRRRRMGHICIERSTTDQATVGPAQHMDERDAPQTVATLASHLAGAPRSLVLCTLVLSVGANNLSCIDIRPPYASPPTPTHTRTYLVLPPPSPVAMAYATPSSVKTEQTAKPTSAGLGPWGACAWSVRSMAMMLVSQVTVLIERRQSCPVSGMGRTVL